jgi:hypothetical protein
VERQLSIGAVETVEAPSVEAVEAVEQADDAPPGLLEEDDYEPFRLSTGKVLSNENFVLSSQPPMTSRHHLPSHEFPPHPSCRDRRRGRICKEAAFVKRHPLDRQQQLGLTQKLHLLNHERNLQPILPK